MGFANASKQMLIQFGEMMEDYFSSRSQLKGLILLVDMRHAPTEDDITMADYARYYEIPFAVAATKLDKVPRSQQSKQINVIAKALACAPEAIIPFSSITKQGRKNCWKRLTPYSIQKSLNPSDSGFFHIFFSWAYTEIEAGMLGRNHR